MSIKSKVVGLLLAFVFVGTNLTPSSAHQPVLLTNSNSTADKGPILVDGTISFAIRANFTKANQTQGFRAALKAGELLNFEYLIMDRSSAVNSMSHMAGLITCI